MRTRAASSLLFSTLAALSVVSPVESEPSRAAVGLQDSLAPVADPEEVLNELQERMSAVDSVYLEFTQEQHLALFERPLESQGVLIVARPDRVRWETTEPYRSILLAEGSAVSQFEWSGTGWRKLRLAFPQLLGQVMTQMANMHQGNVHVIERDYDVAVASGGGVVRLTLRPKDHSIRQVLAAIDVHMLADFSATREVVLREPSGEQTRIVFHGERRELELPPGTFDLESPLDLTAVRAAIPDGS